MKLRDICEIKPGKSLSKDDIIEGTYPVIGGGVKPMGFHNTFNINENEIIISKIGTAGYVAFTNHKTFLTSSGIYLINISNIINKKYLYYYLKYI